MLNIRSFSGSYRGKEFHLAKYFLFLCICSLGYSQSLWQKTSFPDSISVISIAFDSSSNIIYAGTNLYGIYKSTDKGNSWIEKNNGIYGYKIVRELFVYHQNVFAGTEGTLFKSTNMGNSWHAINIGANTIACMTNSRRGDIFAGALQGGMFKSTDEGTSWERIAYFGANAILFDSTENIYANRTSEVYRSSNYGATWQFTAYLRNGPANYPIHCGIMTQSDQIILGTYEGGVYFSPDHASTFITRNSGLNHPDISDLLADEGDHISAITFLRGYYVSIDEAAHWKDLSDGLGNDEPMRLTTDSEGYLYLATYYGGIYRSKFTLSKFLPADRIKKYYKQPNSFTTDSILVKNKSDSTLIVSDVSSNDPVFIVHTQNFSLDPNDSIYFVYSYNPDHRGVNVGKITFRNNSILDSEIVFLEGYSGIPVMQIPFYTLSFGNCYLNEQKDSLMTIKNIGVDTLFVDSINISYTAFGCSYNKTILTPGDSLFLKLSFKPEALTIYKADLVLYSNNYSSPDTIMLAGSGISNPSETKEFEQISAFQLFQNYPNPFNPETKIRYSTSHTSRVFIKIYDVLGREITTLVNEEKPAGIYEISWDGANLPSGLYFYQIRAGELIQAKKMILLK